MHYIYLDHSATTPLRSEVREAMAPYQGERFGNPSSVHRWGREARVALEEARERLAATLGAKRSEIVFTAGGTDADNLAVLGRWRAARADGGHDYVACSAVEHKAVLGAMRQAGREGASTMLLGVSNEGVVEADTVDEALRAKPVVLSVMWGNNEVGTLQNVAEIARRCRSADVIYHTDAVQAFGKVRVRVDEVECDLLSLSAHKIGGPRGIGALYVREGITLMPLLFGGEQERGLRPGTENVAAAVGFAVASEAATQDLAAVTERLAKLRDALQAGLLAAVPDLRVNGGGAPRLPQVLNVAVAGVDQEAILIALDMEGVAVSSGSACQSGATEPSHVLVAMGCVAPSEASVRFSVGPETTAIEVEQAIAKFSEVVSRLREFAAA